MKLEYPFTFRKIAIDHYIERKINNDDDYNKLKKDFDVEKMYKE